MRARLVALGLAAAAALSFAPAADAAIQYERQCSGKVDSQCWHDFCGIADCTRRDCHVYVGLFGDGNSAVCVGQDRPRDPVE